MNSISDSNNCVSSELNMQKYLPIYNKNMNNINISKLCYLMYSDHHIMGIVILCRSTLLTTDSCNKALNVYWYACLLLPRKRANKLRDYAA